MPDIRVQDEQGNVHVFPDGSTPDMIAKAMNVSPPPNAGLAPPSSPNIQMQTSMLGNVVPAAQAVGGYLSQNVQNQGWANPNLPLAQQAMQNLSPSGPASRFAQSASMALPVSTGTQAIRALPSAARAGKAIGEVEDIVGKLPIDTSSVLQPLNRLKELAQRGGGDLPPFAKDFLKRMGVSVEGEVVTSSPSRMTFNEARDFYKNARNMPKASIEKMSGDMQRQTYSALDELGKTIQSTAESAGQGAKFSGAMKEYAQAKTLGDVYDVIKKYGIRSAIGAAGGTIGAGAGYEVLRQLGVIK